MRMSRPITATVAVLAAAASTTAPPALSLAVGAGLATTGCMLRRTPTKVAQGLKFEAGHPNYDPFFTELYEVQLVLGPAPDEEARIRARLARKLGAVEEASAKLLAKSVKSQTEKLAKQGIRLQLVVRGVEEGAEEPPGAETIATGAALDRSAKKTADAIEQAAKDAAELLIQMRQAKTRSETLRQQAPALEPSIDAVFRTDARQKSRVKRNLEDAERLLPLMIQRAQQVGDDAEKLIDLLDTAVNTGPAPAPAAQGDAGVTLEETPQSSPPPSRPAPKRAPKAAPKPAPKPAAPAPPPPPADDFEP